MRYKCVNAVWILGPEKRERHRGDAVDKYNLRATHLGSGAIVEGK